MFNNKKYPNVAKGHQYALDIVDKKIPANKWILGACERYLNDIKRIKEDKECPFYFLPEKAERFLRIVQKMHHAVGDWKTPLIIYEPWQCFVWMNVKGFYAHYSEMVRFRTIHLDVSRGNAKSTMASQASLYDLCCDEPNGNRIYCAATSRDQAKEVLEGAQIMARKNKSFLKNFGVDVMAKEILHKASNSFIKSISAQANNADGKIGKTIITDELHAMKRKLFETLQSGQSKRRDSQIISITTSGYQNDGIGASQRAYAKKVALSEVKDDTFFSMVYCIDEKVDDPWGGPEVWIKANPNFGVSVDPVNFAAQAEKAKINPEDKAGFLIKHLNLYLGSANQYYSKEKWRNCKDGTLKISDFYGERCFVAVDIASKVDITSVCYMFKRKEIYYPFYKNYVPEARLEDPSRQNYRRYVEEGDLIATPGESINLLKFYEDLIKDLKKFKVAAVHADPWNSMELMTKLARDRIEVVEFPQRVGTLSEPMKKLNAEMLEERIRHNTGAMLEWCVGNVVAKVDANDNVFPRKEHESFKIDPIVATIMALAGWIQEEEKSSVYEERGIIVL